LLDFVGASLLATNEFRTCSEFPWQMLKNCLRCHRCVESEAQMLICTT